MGGVVIMKTTKGQLALLPLPCVIEGKSTKRSNVVRDLLFPVFRLNSQLVFCRKKDKAVSNG